MNLFDCPFDAALHLLDRQVVDCDGRLVCKVDDLELTESADGSLAVTALLTGATVLVPRLGIRPGRGLERFWGWLGIEQADRCEPYRITLDHIAELGSDVTLDVSREGLLRRSPEQGRRLNELLDMPVHGPDGLLGHVLDVRVEAEHHPVRRFRVTGFLVGKGRPGTLLGYDRKEEQGPWLLARLVRWLHRDSRQVDVADLRALDWDDGRMEVACSRSGSGTR